MKHLKDASVLVLGLGESGLAMARWCARWGASVTVWDSRENPPHAQALSDSVPNARRLVGALDTMSLQGVQIVLKSPGLAPNDERIAPLIAQARATGLMVQAELDLFATALEDLKAERGYAPKVLAITGTNGKTTTTSMTAQLVECAGLRVAMAGNIGPTMLDTLSSLLDLEPAPASADADEVEQTPWPEPVAELVPDSLLDDEVPADDPADGDEGDIASGAQTDDEIDDTVVPESVADVVAETEVEIEGGGPPPHLIPPPPPGPVFEHLPEVWVLELSSFQLDGVSRFEPTAATVLNVTQDHLDWHGSLEAYAQAKAATFGQNALMVINRDDPLVMAMVPKPVPGKGRFAKPVERQVVRFGLTAPERPGDYGVQTEGGITWMVRALPSDEPIKRKRGAVVEEEDLVIQRLMPTDALRVRGRHNAANALAALALASAAGCRLAPMLHGLREYAGEPHRVQFIGNVDGVDAYDDSKGTNVGATVAALTGLGADKAPSRLVVILGGDGKGQDFAPLLEPIRRHGRAVATIGRDAAAIEAVLQDAGCAVQRHETLEQATRWAFEQAAEGDAVLLSPACASLDMFRNYGHRAEVFVAEVQAIAADRGGMLA